MANKGKFTDRSPCLPAAGLHSKWSEGDVHRCFEHVVTSEETAPPLEGPLDHGVPPGRSDIYRGFDTDVRRCLQPEVERGSGLASVLTEEMQNTVYSSYWKSPLGRTADQTPGLLPGEGPMDRVHGRATDRSHGAGELVSPKKDYAQVMAEGLVGHELYRKTHSNYDPGEQVSRCYGPPYREDLVWGKPTPCDPQGGCAKKVLSTDTDSKLLVSKVFADFKKRTQPLVGKVLAPNDNASLFPPGHAYGRLNRRSPVGAGELLRECDPDLYRLDALEELAYVNQLRGRLRTRPPHWQRELEDAFRQRDLTGCGRLPAKVALGILADHQLHPHESIFNRFLTRTDILFPDGQVDYSKLIDALNANAEFPELPHINDVPDEFLHFETTNQIAHEYHCDGRGGETTTTGRVAGLPPRPHEDVGAILGPSVFTTCGIPPHRVFQPRSPRYVRALLDRIGRHLDDTEFNNVWNLAQDENGICLSGASRGRADLGEARVGVVVRRSGGDRTAR